MSIIEGRAKKYDGTAVDYVSIFNWADGKCIAQVVPDAAGNWSHSHSVDLSVGITYVADGCEPITHGAYSFIAETVPDVYGYLFICRADVRDSANASLDITNTSHPDWHKNFDHASDAAILQYNYETSGIAESLLPATVLGIFDINWVLEVSSLNFNSDLNEHFWTVEFLAADDSVVAAVKSQSAPNRTSQLWYGLNLENLTKTAGPSGAASYGEFSFTASKMQYNNTSTSANNASFSLNADFTSVVAVRVSGIAKAEKDSAAATYSGGYLKVISPVIP